MKLTSIWGWFKVEFGIKTIDDFEVNDKTVLLRVDINEPMDLVTGKLHDITRIEGCAPTIKELANKGARLVILAHQGGDLEYHNYFNLNAHGKILSKLVGKPIEFVPDVCGPYAINRIRALKKGEIILLDNVRFMAEEMTCFEVNLNLSPAEQAKTQIISRLAPLADLYICDAFAAAHRSQPTLVGFEQLLPSAMGRLFEKEYTVLTRLVKDPKKPLVLVLGGAKIQDAFLMMKNMLTEGSVDTILAGGLLGNVMLLSAGVDVGKETLDFIIKKNLGEYIILFKNILKDFGNKIILPIDLAYNSNLRNEIDIAELSGNGLIADIGYRTTQLFIKYIMSAKTVFVNGPMGMFEKVTMEYGTKHIIRALAETKAHTVVGGGDTISALNKFSKPDKIGYICTGGGAMVRFLSGEELPVVLALKHAAKFKV